METEKYTILVVDDIPKNIQVVANILGNLGYNVEVATSGQEALEIAFSEKIDLILLDIMMPEMDGYEVCKRLRQNEITKETPIIFLTAKTETDDIVAGFDVGGQDYVTKPFNAKELIKRVETHLDILSKNRKIKSFAKQLESKNDELNGLNQELTETNTELTETIDALTKAKIGRKAAILAIIITISLFLVSEGILEPYIDSSLQDQSFSFFWSMLLKGIIALLFIPMERILKKALLFNTMRKK
jgi:CheY-like chemotaxis protein